jgi:nitrogen regulatory protein PII
MKIVMIVFRASMEEDVLRLLADLGVKAFTDVPKVFGLGESGRAFASFGQPGSNAMILAALDDAEAALLVDGLKEFHRRSARDQHGAKIPLRAFVIPCVQAL